MLEAQKRFIVQKERIPTYDKRETFLSRKKEGKAIPLVRMCALEDLDDIVYSFPSCGR